jgi:hypothetical protein
VLLSTPLHTSSNFTVSVQLANKRGFTKKYFIEFEQVAEDKDVSRHLLAGNGISLTRYTKKFRDIICLCWLH